MGGFGEKEGIYATYILAMGFFYIILRQTWVRKQLVKYVLANKQYGKILMYSLRFHIFAMLCAIVLGIYHGIGMLIDDGFTNIDSITGILALFLMIYLSGSGIVIWRRFPKKWVSANLRKRARFIHRNKILWIILIVTVALHLVFVL